MGRDLIRDVATAERARPTVVVDPEGGAGCEREVVRFRRVGHPVVVREEHAAMDEAVEIGSLRGADDAAVLLVLHHDDNDMGGDRREGELRVLGLDGLGLREHPAERHHERRRDPLAGACASHAVRAYRPSAVSGEER